MTLLEKPTHEVSAYPEYAEYANQLTALLSEVVGDGESGAPVRHQLKGVNTTVVPDVIKAMQEPGSFFANVLLDPFSELRKQYRNSAIVQLKLACLQTNLLVI